MEESSVSTNKSPLITETSSGSFSTSPPSTNVYSSTPSSSSTTTTSTSETTPTKDIPTSETLGGFITRCSELVTQYRDLVYALKQVTYDKHNVLQPLVHQLLHTTEHSLLSCEELIDVTLGAVRSKLAVNNPSPHPISSSPNNINNKVSPTKSTTTSTTTANLSTALLLSSSPVSNKVPIKNLIPNASLIWFKHLQEEYLQIIVKATIVGADPQLKAPTENDNGLPPSSPPKESTNEQHQHNVSSFSGANSTRSSFSTENSTLYTAKLSNKYWKDIEILCAQSYTGHPRGGMRLPPLSHTRYSWNYPVPWQVKLYRAIVLAREIERTIAFTTELQEEIKTLTSNTYIYNSSLFYYNFLQILEDPLYQSYIKTIQYNQQLSVSSSTTSLSPSSSVNSQHRDIVVLGSSIGLIQFYISCTNNVRTIGVDILPIMIQTGYGIAVFSGILDSSSLTPSTTSTTTLATSSSSTSSPLVQFLQGDIATINPSIFRNAGIIFCNSPSWNPRVRRSIYARLLMQCPKDTLIIDYVHPHGLLWKENTGNTTKSKERLAILPISPTRTSRITSPSVKVSTTESSSSKLYEVRELEYLMTKPYDIDSDIYHSLYYSKITVQIWTEEQLQKYSLSTNYSINNNNNLTSSSSTNINTPPSSSSLFHPLGLSTSTMIIPTSIPKLVMDNTTSNNNTIITESSMFTTPSKNNESLSKNDNTSTTTSNIEIDSTDNNLSTVNNEN